MITAARLVLMGACLVASISDTMVVAADHQKLEGLWHVISVMADNATDDVNRFQGKRLLVRGETVALGTPATFIRGGITAAADAGEITIPAEDSPDGIPAIWRRQGDRLEVCLSNGGEPHRPGNFDVDGTKNVVLSLKRVQATALQDLKQKPERLEVRYSQLGYRDTLAFYSFFSKRRILVVNLGNRDESFPIRARVHQFAESVTEEGMRMWINNQHSDGLFVDVPMPLKTTAVSGETCWVVGVQKTGTSQNPGPLGGTSTDFELRIQVQPEDGDDEVELPGFSDSLRVHVVKGLQ